MQATQHRNLYRRGQRGLYYVRKYIPRAIYGAYPPGKREVVLSLGTSDEREALRRSHKVLARVDQEFEEKRRQLARRAEKVAPEGLISASGELSVSPELAKVLETLLVRHLLQGDEEQRRQMAASGQFEQWHASLERRLAELRRAMAHHDLTDWDGMFEVVAKEAGMRFSIAQADRPRVAELTLRAAVKAVQLQIDACNGQPVSLDTLAPPEALKTVTTSWDAVFEAWETHVKDRPKSTVIHQRTAWNGLLEFAKSRGVLFPGQVSTGLIADWVAQMQQRLGHKTVTERLGKVKRVYRVAVARELLTSDPAAKVLSPREPNHMKGLSHRKPFSKADLQVIFGCPIFTQHLRSAGQIGVTCPPKSVPRQRNRICATERTRDAQEQVHRRADHWFHQAG